MQHTHKKKKSLVFPSCGGGGGSDGRGAAAAAPLFNNNTHLVVVVVVRSPALQHVITSITRSDEETHSLTFLFCLFPNCLLLAVVCWVGETMKDEIDALNAFSLSLSNTHSPLLFFLCDMEVGKKKGEIGRVSSSSGLEENRKNPSSHPQTHTMQMILFTCSLSCY